MNIYCLEFIGEEVEDRIWTQGESAMQAVCQAYGDLHATDEMRNYAGRVTIKVTIAQPGMTMDEFEAKFPEFFFT